MCKCYCAVEFLQVLLLSVLAMQQMVQSQTTLAVQMVAARVRSSIPAHSQPFGVAYQMLQQHLGTPSL